MKLSFRLQDIAQSLGEILDEVAGERTAFVLMVNTDNVTQYVSNVHRGAGMEMIEELLTRWKANRADIPAHYNPDLKRRL